MTILDAAFWTVCLVLVASGATKVAEPAVFADALVSLGAGSPAAHLDDDGHPARWAAVVVGIAEIGIGLDALVLGGRAVAALAAVLYGAFTVVVLVARRRGLVSCGCFGARSGAPSTTHAALNAGSALVCAAAAVRGPVGLADGLDGLSTVAAGAVVLAVLVVVGAIVVVDTR